MSKEKETPESPSTPEVASAIAEAAVAKAAEAIKKLGKTPAVNAKPLTMRRADALLTMDIRPPEAIIDNVIFNDEIIQIVAFRGTGKTFFGLSIAAGIAAGLCSIPGWSVPAARPVIYVDGELPHGRLKARVEAVFEGLEITKPVPLYTVSRTDEDNRDIFRSISSAEGRSQIDDMIESIFDEYETMPVLSLDSLSTLMDGSDENVRESFVEITEWLIRLRGRGVVTIIFHHTGWSQEHGRGSSFKEDVIDTSIRLRNPRDKKSTEGARFEVLFDKARNFEPGAAESFELCLEAAPHGGVIFTRLKVGERRAADLWDDIREVVKGHIGCSLNFVASNVGIRKADVTKEINKRIALGDLLNSGTGNAYKLSLPEFPGYRPDPLNNDHQGAVETPASGFQGGDTPGTTFSTGSGSQEKVSGNKAEPVGNHLGTSPGTSSGSVVPTPMQGCGNHLGTNHTCESEEPRSRLPADPEEWTGEAAEQYQRMIESGEKPGMAAQSVAINLALPWSSKEE